MHSTVTGMQFAGLLRDGAAHQQGALPWHGGWLLFAGPVIAAGLADCVIYRWRPLLYTGPDLAIEDEVRYES